MIKEGLISKFSLLLDVRNLALELGHFYLENLINLVQKIKAILYVFRSLDGKFIFCHVGTL